MPTPHKEKNPNVVPLPIMNPPCPTCGEPLMLDGSIPPGRQGPSMRPLPCRNPACRPAAEDYKIKGYHSKSEMRRIETLKAAAEEKKCCDFSDDGKSLKPAKNGGVLKICMKHQSLFLKGNVPVAAEEGEELKHAEDCDGTVCTRCATDIVDRTRKDATEEAWRGAVEAVPENRKAQIGRNGECLDCGNYPHSCLCATFNATMNKMRERLIQAAKDRGVDL